MLLLIKNIYNYIKNIFNSKNISVKSNNENGISFYIDSKNHIMMNVDINDPDTLSLDELTDNAEKTAIIITSIINGDINDQILKFIKKSSKTIETSASTNLFFQNVLNPLFSATYQIYGR